MNRDTVLMGRIEEALEKRANESLTERLRSGEKVGGNTLQDLLDCELSSIVGYSRSFHKVSEIMTSEYPETSLLQEQFWGGLIERYLHDKPELIEEEIAQILEGQEEAQWD